MSKKNTARKSTAYVDESNSGKVVDKGTVDYLGRVIYAGAVKSHETAVIALVNNKYLALLFEVEPLQKGLLKVPSAERDALENWCLEEHLNILTKDKLHEPFIELLRDLNREDDGEPPDMRGWNVFWGYTDPVDADIMRILMFYPPDTEKEPQRWCRPFIRRSNESRDEGATYVEIFDRNNALIDYVEEDASHDEEAAAPE